MPAEVDLLVDVNAALFCAVHDILRCPESVKNILSQLRPGAHLASSGGKSAAPWLILLNSYAKSSVFELGSNAQQPHWPS